MTRLFLAAGVAALALATAAAAKPGEHGGGNPHGGGGAPQAQHGGGGGRGGGPQFARGGGGGGGGPRFQAFARGGGPRVQMQAFRGGGPRFAAPRMQRFAMPRAQRGPRMFAQHGQRQQRFAMPRAPHMQRYAMEHRAPRFARQQAHGRTQFASNRAFQREQLRTNRGRQAQNQRQFGTETTRLAHNGRTSRQQLNAGRMQVQQQAFAQQPFNGRQLKGQQFNRQQMNGQNFAANQFRVNGGAQKELAFQQALNAQRSPALNYGISGQVLPVTDVERFVGAPVASVAGLTALSPMPATISYLYPATPDYYYQYGDGYVYQIDRTDNVIAALIPLLAGGYLPGQYLPAPYMASYVPDYYGFSAFYPDYGDVCNRYAYGVVYQVDCYSGMVEDVIPVYASGYGVGQILPTSYAYYNVPYQYRSLYYDTPTYNYWYAPGAIYQYDPRTSMITSVAALLSPGFTVGQALPAGYDVYNVPYAYRATYYDTPTVWYRYSNGYIYQVDPVTRLVTAVVASLLT